MKNNIILRIFLLIIGTISLCLGIIGIVLPILPTVPFLLLTLICYSKASHTFKMYFIKTKVYKKYLEPIILTRCMTNSYKLRLILVIIFIVIIPIIFIDILIVRIILALIVIIHIYFIVFKIKSVSKVELKTIHRNKLMEKDNQSD